jgi:hypothetical protein
MMHLLNYLGHFPLGSGATQLSSSVHELSTTSGDHIDDVKQASALSASNIQVCFHRYQTSLVHSMLLSC